MQGRVLVVSADPARRRTFRDNLFLAGHAVFDVPNRSAALEACEDFEPSTAVVDLSGSRQRALWRAERGKPAKTTVDCNLITRIASRFPSVRVIAICDGNAGSTPEEAISSGARDYLKEPLCIGDLLVRVDRHLGISTRVKKLRRPSPRPRRKIVIRSGGASGTHDAVEKLAADLETHQIGTQGVPEAPAMPNLLSETDLVGHKPDAQTPQRLGDLISPNGSSQAMTMVWISLQGLDRISTLGFAGYEAVSHVVDQVLENFVPGCSKWWVGSEAVAAFTGQMQAPVEAAIELKAALSEKLDQLGLATDLALRVSATARRWGEGRALFLARATGRISNGGLPIFPFAAGSKPHPSVALPAGAAGARIAAAETRADIGT
jgi:DNA-binding response OmpR family regulator